MDIYPIGRGIVGAILKPFYRIQIIGKENIPTTGGALLCANHIHYLDPPVLGITSPRPVHFMAKKELFEQPILKHLLPKFHAFPVNRGKVDRTAFRTALKRLKEGEIVGIFPEGTRSTDGNLRKGLAGAGFFALKGGVDVIPCAIISEYKIGRPTKVVYGEPIPMEPFRERKASAQEVSDFIMEKIGELKEKHEK